MELESNSLCVEKEERSDCTKQNVGKQIIVPNVNAAMAPETLILTKGFIIVSIDSQFTQH